MAGWEVSLFDTLSNPNVNEPKDLPAGIAALPDSVNGITEKGPDGRRVLPLTVNQIALLVAILVKVRHPKAQAFLRELIEIHSATLGWQEQGSAAYLNFHVGSLACASHYAREHGWIEESKRARDLVDEQLVWCLMHTWVDFGVPRVWMPGLRMGAGGESETLARIMFDAGIGDTVPHGKAWETDPGRARRRMAWEACKLLELPKFREAVDFYRRDRHDFLQSMLATYRGNSPIGFRHRTWIDLSADGHLMTYITVFPDNAENPCLLTHILPSGRNAERFNLQGENVASDVTVHGPLSYHGNQSWFARECVYGRPGGTTTTSALAVKVPAHFAPTMSAFIDRREEPVIWSTPLGATTDAEPRPAPAPALFEAVKAERSALRGLDWLRAGDYAKARDELQRAANFAGILSGRTFS
jgi:hypothetical protein